MTRIFLRCSKEELKKEIEEMGREKIIDGGKVQLVSCTLSGKIRLKMSDSPKDTLYLLPEELLKILNEYDLVQSLPSRLVKLRLKEGDYYE